MNVRVKFSKYGFTKFIGHLDVVRYFQKAIRRSGLAVAYSEGFNPHQLLYFAAPLGLGQTSDGEYMDAELKKEYPLEEIRTRLNAVMTDGFYVQSVTRLPEWKPGQKKESIMALTACVDYMVSVKDMEVDGKAYAEYFQGFREKFTEFMRRPEIMVEKESKKSTRTADIRPMIFAWGFMPEDIVEENAGDMVENVREDFTSKNISENIIFGENGVEGIRHAQVYENGLRVFLKLSSGSVNNLKPELVMEVFCKEYNLPYRESALQFHRMETYCDLCLNEFNQEERQAIVDSGKTVRKLVPLFLLHAGEPHGKGAGNGV